MKIELNDDALVFGEVVRDALGAAGGDELIQRAEADPAGRDELVGAPLGELGVWDLDVRGSADELEAAAAVCRSVGWWAAPGAVAERLARPIDLGADALAVVAGPRPSAPVHDSSLRWVATDLDGNRSNVRAMPLGTTPRKAAFVADLELEPIDAGAGDDALFGLLLPCWTLLGMLDRTIDLTVEYVKARQQFGRPLSKFQSVQFQLTEAEVERVGFAELAKYTTWSVARAMRDREPGRRQERQRVADTTAAEPQALSMDDALALRLAAIDAAEVVFRIGHQLHGAIGFCDETTISWISRYSQPIRRLPLPASGTRDALARRIRHRGLVGIYS